MCPWFIVSARRDFDTSHVFPDSGDPPHLPYTLPPKYWCKLKDNVHPFIFIQVFIIKRFVITSKKFLLFYKNMNFIFIFIYKFLISKHVKILNWVWINETKFFSATFKDHLTLMLTCIKTYSNLSQQPLILNLFSWNKLFYYKRLSICYIDIFTSFHLF